MKNGTLTSPGSRLIWLNAAFIFGSPIALAIGFLTTPRSFAVHIIFAWAVAISGVAITNAFLLFPGEKTGLQLTGIVVVGAYPALFGFLILYCHPGRWIALFIFSFFAVIMSLAALAKSAARKRRASVNPSSPVYPPPRE